MPTEPLRHTYAGRCPGSQERVTLDTKCPACAASEVRWCCARHPHDGGNLYLLGPTCRTRKEAQRWAVSLYRGSGLTWKQLYRQGWRCIKVLVQPVEAVIDDGDQ